MFAEELKSKGWADNCPPADYSKGDWSVSFDASSWVIVSTEGNPRVFDVHVPAGYESRWTVNLIEHLCRMEDERRRLRKALETIRDMPGAAHAASAAAAALGRCYHRWLINVDIPRGKVGRCHCPVCGQLAADGGSD